jgi:hypothetical protein
LNGQEGIAQVLQKVVGQPPRFASGYQGPGHSLQSLPHVSRRQCLGQICDEARLVFVAARGGQLLEG